MGHRTEPGESKPPATCLRVGAATDRGHVRDLNEDVYELCPEQGLFIVCDGMGGAPAGEVASQIAAQAILQHLNTTRHKVTSPCGEERRFHSTTCRLAEAVRESNRVIYEQGQQDARRSEMGTTVVSAWFQQDMVSVAHVGDSRAYLWHNGHLESLTRDHTLLEALIAEGLSEYLHAVAADPQDILVRVLGVEPEVEVDLAEIRVQPGDYVLLCSDGLTRMVPEAALGNVMCRLDDPQRICDCLIETANDNGGTDDITVVVVEVVGT